MITDKVSMSRVIQMVKSIVEPVVDTSSQNYFVVNVAIKYCDKANDITKKWLFLNLFFFSVQQKMKH